MKATVLYLLAVMALAASPQVTHANFGVQTGGLKVEFPSNSRKVYDMALANFGQPKYGGRLTGKAIYLGKGYLEVDYDCKPGCEYACTPFTDAKPPFKVDKSVQGQIMLVDRGPYGQKDFDACKFVDKVWNAQLAGAAAVVVMSHEEELVTPETPLDQNSPGFVKNITIPAGFVSASVGDALKKLLKGKEDVIIAMDWVDVLPKEEQVKWEFWTNGNDNCGNNCELQRLFVQDFALYAQKLDEANHTSFSPHFIVWSCLQDSRETEACKSQCIRNARYCSPDPEADLDIGYEGRDIMVENLRQMCLYQVAVEDGKPWMWWKYSAAFWNACGVTKNKYGVACSEKVFLDIGGHLLLGGKGLAKWRKCIDEENIDEDKPIPLLEAELKRTKGTKNSASVSVVPTILINGDVYRGVLKAPSVMRAICSGFVDGTEPAVCANEWVSGDECREGKIGYTTCNNRTNTEERKTKCRNTFPAFECDCEDGYLEVEDENGNSQCMDINECSSVSMLSKFDNCTCERCACHNLEGSFRCEDNIINECEMDNGGCWQATIDGKSYSACVDKISEYKELAAAGKMDPAPSLHECKCPACFAQDANGACSPVCDLDECEKDGGDCTLSLLSREASKTSKGGISLGVLATIIVFLVIAVVVVAFLGYRKLRGQMHSELDFIMTHYMPLNEDKPGTASDAPMHQDEDVLNVTQLKNS